MIGSSRIAPVSLLLVITLAIVPTMLWGSLPSGGASASAATTRSPVATSPALAVHLKHPPFPVPAGPAQSVHPNASRGGTEDGADDGALSVLTNATDMMVAELTAADNLSDGAPRPRRTWRKSSAEAAVTANAPARSAAAPPPQAPLSRTQMLWPTSGKITSRFGWRTQPIFGGPEFHTGLDIATRWGSPVLAARAGVVRFVGWESGYGEMVIVSHGAGIETAYAHLSSTAVRPGEAVVAGQLLGRIGSTGWSTGPHLLFEVRANGVPVDPAKYLH